MPKAGQPLFSGAKKARAKPAQKQAKAAQSPLETYLREINAVPLLSADEEVELAKRIKTGDAQAREHMTRANLRLVVNIARGYQGKGLGLQDLIEEGNLGLIRAVSGFDPKFGTRFSTYASYWIKQAIKIGLINQGRTVRIPAYMVELMGKFRQAKRTLQEPNTPEPTFDAVCDHLGIKKRQRGYLAKALANAAGTNGNGNGQAHADDDSHDPMALLGEGSADQALEGLDKQELLTGLSSLIPELMESPDANEQRYGFILANRFGLFGADPKILKTIGEEMGLTRERVRQLEAEALAYVGKLLVGEEEYLEAIREVRPKPKRKRKPPCAVAGPLLPKAADSAQSPFVAPKKTTGKLKKTRRYK
ncbi:MAG: sigma-70 family RNA polymerase sigma factor [Cyanobacteria bacterium HKST-UBA04]|nr:sigma-70 family RNA polymerase sigma factor [Cyanobacteria bacterium HKST-UBA04]